MRGLTETPATKRSRACLRLGPMKPPSANTRKGLEAAQYAWRRRRRLRGARDGRGRGLWAGGADWSQARTLAGMAVMKPTSLPERSARTPTCHSRRKCGGLRALRAVRMSGTRSRGGDGLGEGSPAEEGDGVVEAEHVVVVLHVVFVEQRVDVQHLRRDATLDGEGELEARPAQVCA